MESNNNKLKENDIKNFTCYYFEEISNSNHLEWFFNDLNNFLMNENPYNFFLIYGVFWKTPYGAKPFSIIIDKIDRYIKKYDKTKYWYLTMLKSNILSVYSPNMTIIVDNHSSDDLTLAKTLNTQNLLILIRCFLIKIIIVIDIKCF